MTPLSQALTELSRFLVSESSVGDTLHRVAEISVEAVPGVSFAGISMLGVNGQPTTGIFTDERAPEIDQGQYESGEGPCLDAWRTRQMVRLDDIRTDGAKYPAFQEASLDRGILSLLSVPLVSGDNGMGALNLYAESERAFSHDDETVLAELGTAASVVLANVVAYWDAYDASEQMNAAMRSRAVIEQAKGMVMAQSPGMSADDAFDRLREVSQRDNVKLREVAQRMVDGQLPPTAPS